MAEQVGVNWLRRTGILAVALNNLLDAGRGTEVAGYPSYRR
jgi:hypothetical protein